MKYRTCDTCGANLDFGERCDCESEKRDAAPQPDKENKEDGGAQYGAFRANF